MTRIFYVIAGGGVRLIIKLRRGRLEEKYFLYFPLYSVYKPLQNKRDIILSLFSPSVSNSSKVGYVAICLSCY